MKQTKRWNLTVNVEESEIDASIGEAVEFLKTGEIIAFPTETVYGLGADATNSEAIVKVFQAKGRPQDNPLIVHVATKKQLFSLVENVPDYVEKLINNFSPGPITYVLPSNGKCVENVTAGLSTIGVRIPDHPIALKLLQICNRPVAAPSANISGKPSPTNANHVWDDLNGKIAGIVDGGPTGVGVESTVLDCTQQIPVILRPGGVTREEIEKVVGHVMVDPALINDTEKPKSPGMKYKHYAPEVPLWIVKGSLEQLQEIINKQKQSGKKIAVLTSTSTYSKIKADEKLDLGINIKEIATNLYDGLRIYKHPDIDIIICEAFSEDGLGQAVMNRLQKAASRYVNFD